MIPNKFVILWDEMPIEIVNKFPVAAYPRKTENPHKIYWFDTRVDALRFINTQSLEKRMRVIEIQFRIMDKP